MEGIAERLQNTENKEALQELENAYAHVGAKFSEFAEGSFKQFFDALQDEEPSELYNLVISKVERPLIAMTLRFTGGNQSRAAKILNISRGTLRKKMSIYGFLKKRKV